MAGNRFRYVDYWHFNQIDSSDKVTNDAADEIINNPEKHLLTQD
jgi:hypothetical protein